ncbi:MAG: tetratricopeptide repeat protein [Azoarcus sp.]|nr:tetratricopeptide repeat protein [Azoarcus sp.]
MNVNNFFTCAATSAKRFSQKTGKAIIAMILAFGLAIGGMGIHGFAHAKDENLARISVERARLASQYSETAKTHYEQGDYTAALALNQKALAIREEVLGKQHPDTALSYNNIGVMAP